MTKERAAVWVAFCALQIVPIVCVLVPLRFEFGVSFQGIVEAWWLAQVSLLLLWVSLGTGWLSVRYLVAAVLVVFVGSGLRAPFTPNFPGRWDFLYPTEWDIFTLGYFCTILLSLLVAVSACGAFRNIWRWRFAWTSLEDSASGIPAVVEHEAMSFRFIRNIIGVAVCCLILFVGVVILGDSGGPSPGTFGAGYILLLPLSVLLTLPGGLAYSAFAVSAVLAIGVAPTPLRVATRMVLLSITLVLLATFYRGLPSFWRAPTQPNASQAVLPLVVLVASLLLMRAGGYRLVRGTRLVASEIVPVDNANTSAE